MRSGLHPSTLPGPATVMRHRADIFYYPDIYPRGHECPDSTFATGPRALCEYIDSPHTHIHALLGDIPRGLLCCERSRLARTLEALGTTGTPGNGIAFSIGNGDYRVIEG